MSATLASIIERLRSPHAGRVYVAKDYTKADLIADLEALAAREALDTEHQHGP